MPRRYTTRYNKPKARPPKPSSDQARVKPPRYRLPDMPWNNRRR